VLAVAPTAKRHELEQGGSVAATRMVDGFFCVPQHAENVVSERDVAVDVERGSAVRHFGDGHLFVDRCGVGELVVLDDDDEGKLVNGREVQPFVEIAGAGSAVAGKGDVNVRLALHLECEREPGAGGNPGRHRAVVVRRDTVAFEVSEEQTELASMRRRDVFAEPASDDMARLDAPVEPRGEASRHGGKNIVFVQQRGDPGGDGLLADAEVDGSDDLALAVERREPHFERAREPHRAVHAHQLVVAGFVFAGVDL